MPTTPVMPPELSTLPGAAILVRLRRLLLCVIVAGLVYSVLTNASSGHCADAGTVDSPGDDEGAASVVTSCVTLTLRPSPFVYIALAVIVLVALGRVLRTATTVPRALAIVDRAAVVAVVVAGASWLIAVVWFLLLPVETWDGTGSFWFPFPFGAVELTTSTTG
ncbi:hypothetical protein [Leifsonia aquatica]|uniref:hypothetical protein n=1 Tax=Leifsonia aquatica TaxID=144185 RepID=UPI0028A69982|nr:hypothetical protein [Leifsonia aquatica]